MDRRSFLCGLGTASAVLVVPGAALAQRGRYTSPAARTVTVIGGKEFSVDYYAPSMHGRKVMGGLVPYDEVWCTGANIATGFHVGADIEIGALKVPKGAYSIWTLPGEKEWTLILNKETGQFHLNYRQSLDFGRTKMLVKRLDQPVETFRVEVRKDGDLGGMLALVWETTEAYLPFRLA
jgi:hypothetical protein